MTILIDAKAMKNEKLNVLKDRVKEINNKINRIPKLVIVSASNDKASELYMNNKIKTGKEVGVNVEILRFDNNVVQDEIEKTIVGLNKDNSVDGIIVQLPIYKHLDKDKIISMIDSSKDADGFSYENLGMMFSGDHKGILPCTAKSVYEMLKHHEVDIEGKRICIIGRGLHTGKSLSSLLIHDGATVTVCNSKTNNIEDIIKDSDIVISSVGQYGLIEPEWMKEGSVLIGIGIDYVNGKQQTDYDIDEMVENSKCSLVSNRINSVGLGTTLFLMENTIKLCEVKYGIK